MIQKSFNELVGKTIIDVQGLEKYSECVFFISSCGKKYKLFHRSQCCENVSIEDIWGDVNDILNSPIIIAEESMNNDYPKDDEYPDESFTWSFYKIDTIKGGITIRWYGSSNGCYSETCEFYECDTI